MTMSPATSNNPLTTHVDAPIQGQTEKSALIMQAALLWKFSNLEPRNTRKGGVPIRLESRIFLDSKHQKSKFFRKLSHSAEKPRWRFFKFAFSKPNTLKSEGYSLIKWKIFRNFLSVDWSYLKIVDFSEKFWFEKRSTLSKLTERVTFKAQKRVFPPGKKIENEQRIFSWNDTLSLPQLEFFGVWKNCFQFVL